MKRTEFSPHGTLHMQHLERSEKYDMPIPHYHDAYEIYFQAAGKRYLFFDNSFHVMGPGDVVILRPFDIHYGESREAEFYERYVMNFKEELFSRILSEEERYLLDKKIYSCAIHLKTDEMEWMKLRFQTIGEYSGKTGFLAEKLLASAVLQMTMFLVERMKGGWDLEHASAPIVEVLKYIDRHYQETITLDEMAQMAHMSKYHFCRTFRSVTGDTAVDYLRTVRLTRAHNLLMHTTERLDEIARKTGFTSYVNLARAFKNVYGMSPRNFRKQYGSLLK